MENITIDVLICKLEYDYKSHTQQITISEELLEEGMNVCGFILENNIKHGYYCLLLSKLLKDLEKQKENNISCVVKLQSTLKDHVDSAFGDITNQSTFSTNYEIGYLLYKLRRDAKCAFYQKYKDFNIVK